MRIAVLYPSDPLGFVPSGIDSFVRGMLKWAPEDLQYTLFGATTDSLERPIGREVPIPGKNREARFIPLLAMDPAGRRARIPLTIRYMWALRRFVARGAVADFDILHFQRPEPIALFRRDPRPINLVLHQDMSVIRGGSSDILWRYMPWLYEQIEKSALAAVDHVFCVRQTAVDRYRMTYPDSAGKFDFIPTWVDTDIFAPIAEEDARSAWRDRVRNDLSLPLDARLLVFVGRLDRQKDPTLLLEAFFLARKREPDLHLVVIGDGALRAALESRIQTAGIGSAVRLLGAVPGHRIAAILKGSDLFVLTSAYEGMPIAVLEALATGLPVVATDVGEIRLVVKEGFNGTISGERTAEAFAGAIRSALMCLDSLRGAPCVSAAARFAPEAVLGPLYRQDGTKTRTIVEDKKSA